jgi:hypothetical protein
MGGHLERAAKPDALGSGPLTAFASAGADERAFKLGEPAKDRKHQLTMRRSSVGPRVLERPKACAALLDGIEYVEQIARGAR